MLYVAGVDVVPNRNFVVADPVNRSLAGSRVADKMKGLGGGPIRNQG